ncbi:homocysteine S-methyltransferase [Saccharopolyspora hordei]|uniref:S-methylmethionine:homocysteine methyltransferase n=1 Tax=Saccharopolyspora hordei TaxID=1838 RepID=A0A853ATB6_9PSEU|nr:homocysteine S-methyltransferase [Saccharopolyspora hordei]NYI85891.1 homocysteine S-methyltransferase [Saccharopolyspora hordei]
MNAFPLGGATTILDGGLATELEARGHDLSDALWSARLLADAPEEIVAAHATFFRAGADVATTASYQASFEGFAARGIDRGDAAALMRRSVELARLAGDVEPGRHRWVAASIGPYGAMLADGSEYRGRYGRTRRELRDFHRPRMEVLAESRPDVFALETVPDVDEAEALVDALDGLDVPAWLSYTVDGDRTRAGQPLAEAFAVAEHDGVVAVGVNCSAPDDVLPAIEIARVTTTKPVVVYPNSGEGWDAQRQAWTGESRLSPSLARSWRDAGAQLIGGCCRVRPDDISAIAEALLDPEG